MLSSNFLLCISLFIAVSILFTASFINDLFIAHNLKVTESFEFAAPVCSYTFGLAAGSAPGVFTANKIIQLPNFPQNA